MTATANTSVLVQPVVMAGGSGTRLWPLSRAGYPKQFLVLAGNRSLFQQAAARLQGLGGDGISVANPCIVGNEEHRFLVIDQLREFLEHGNISNSVNFPNVDMARESAYRISVANANVPNMLGQISTAMAQANLNIRNMLNKSRGDMAYTLVDVDSAVPASAMASSATDPASAMANATRELKRAEQLLAYCRYYDAARAFARLVSIDNQCDDKRDYVIITGGGPGIMEAANRGAFDVGCKSIGLNIKLPSEQQPNPFITPELCFQFKYFALRKFHFILRAAAVVLFPGGFGTLDEMFETLTLRQTHRMQPVPIILFGRDYWSKVINFQFLADSGVIADEHLKLFTYAETPEEAWQQILDFHEMMKPQA